jgi:hypothetical protein
MKKTLALIFVLEVLVALGFSSALSQADSIALTSGNGQSGTVGTSLSQPFVVTVYDTGGAPLSGVPVTFSIFTVPSGATGQSLTVTSASTDLNGRASSTLKLGSKPGAYVVRATNAALTGSPITFNATAVLGPPSQVRVETKSDGTGELLPDTSLVAGTSLTGYAITRDAQGNFLANVQADGWSLLSKTGGVVDADLVVNANRRSAVFTGHLVGSANVEAAVAGVTSVAGGPVTVTPGADARVQVETKADGSGTLVAAQPLASGNSLTVYSIVRDALGNFKSNVAATAWSLSTKTLGVVDGDLVASGDSKSAVFTGHVAGTGVIHVTSGVLTPGSSGLITVTAGTATKLRIETAANGTGVVFPSESLQSGKKDTAYAISRDASDNFVANIAADPGSWSLISKTGGVVDGDLVPSGDLRSAIFTAHAMGSGVIHATSGALAVTNSGVITVTVGAATKIRIETKADGTGTLVPDQTVLAGRSFTAYLISRDTADNFVANVAATAWSTVNETGGLADSNLTVAGDRKSVVFTGEVPGTGKIQATLTGYTAATSGTITVSLGTAARIRIETKADGTGILVPAQSILASRSITAYAISRDSANNFLANVAATTWGTQSETGGVADSDLVASPDRRSAVFTGHVPGTGLIAAQLSPLVSVPSGVITVALGTAAKVRVETKADGTGVIVPDQTVPSGDSIIVYSVSRDSANNFIANVAATQWSLPTKTGAVADGDLDPSANNRNAVFKGNGLGTAKIQATSGTLQPVTSGLLTVSVGTAAKLTFDPSFEPSTVVSRAVMPQVKVVIQDRNGHQVSDTRNVTLSLLNNPAGGTLGGTTTVAAVGGVATFSDLTIDKADSHYTMRATSSPSLITDASNVFVVQPGPVAGFTVEDSSGAAIPAQFAGVPFKVRISARDAAGNVATSFTGAVTVSANNGGILGSGGGTTAAFTNGVLAAHTVSFNNIGSFSLTVRSGFDVGTSNTFAVTAGAPGQVVFVQQPGITVAGVAIAPAITVQLQDALGNPVAQPNVQIVMDISSGTGNLTGLKTRSTNAFGLATFSSLSIDSAGVKILRARSGTLTPALSDTFSITPAAATRLAFTVQPGTGNGGVALSDQPVVSLQDQFGNTVTGTDQAVTLAIQNNPSLGVLGGTKSISINTLTGQAVFSDISIDRAGTGYTLTATGNTVSTTPGVVVSNPFDVTSGAPAKLAFFVQPSNTVAGVVINPAVVVQVQDAFGNLVSVNDTLVTISMDSSGNLAGNTSRRTIAGNATFNDLYIDKQGSKVLAASGGGFAQAVSNSFTISPAAAAKLAFATQPGNGIAGLPFGPQPVVTLLDAYGNIVTGAPQVVTLSLKDTAATGASLNGTKAVAVDVSKGTASFSGLSIDKAGVGYTLTATGATVDTARGVVVSQPLTVSAGSAKKIRVETLADGKGTPLGTQNVSSGNPISVFAIARDSLDNFVANTAVDQWKLIELTGGAKETDLVPAGDMKSAVFTGGATGSSARIMASVASLKADTTGVLSVVQAGSPAKVFVETLPNGTGTIVPAQNISSGGSITVYAVERDAANNFVANAPADSWSMHIIAGDMQQSDLVPSSDKKSAVFTAHRMGKVQLVAVIGTLTQVRSDTIRVTPGTPATVSVASKSPDSARVDNYFGSRLVSIVRDSSGNPVRNVLVTYYAPATGATNVFDEAIHTATTDSLGFAASKSTKANTVIGQYVDTARVVGIAGEALFTLRNLAGPPRTITAVSGAPQTTVVASAFPLPLVVAVRDSFGNPADSALVTFSAPASGASGTFLGGGPTNTGYTNAQGLATSAVFVANMSAGTYTVNATGPGIAAPAAFSLTNRSGSANNVTPLAGTPQSAVVGAAFTTRFKALVKDGAGNPVGNTTVRFTAPLSGASGKFTGGIVDTAKTDSAGVAIASVFTADTLAGTYRLLATVDGSPGSAEFTLTNIAGPVDTFSVEGVTGGDIGEQIAHVAFPVRVRAKDQYGNVATTFIGTVTMSASTALLSGGGKTPNFVAGVLDSHMVRVQNAGSLTLTATRTGGAETGTSNSFQVVNPAPTIKSIIPSNGLAGQTMNVVILGTGFLSGVTSVTFGDQVTTSTVVTNDTTLSVKITIDATAALGPRNVIVFNAAPGGSPPFTKVSGFTVGDNARPHLEYVTPDTAVQMQTTKLIVHGSNFLGSTDLSIVPSAGITIDSLTVIDSTFMSFKVSITSAAAPGLHSIIVKNPPPGGGSDTLQGGLRIIAGNLRPPTLASPANGAQAQPSTLTLTWQASVGATRYDIQVAMDSLFSSANMVVSDSLLTATSKQIGPLSIATVYYWHVRSRNASEVSSWSAAWSFDNITYPSTYTLNDTVSFQIRTNGSEYPASEYRLIGLPGAHGGSLSALIPGTAGSEWQAYWDNGGSSNFWVKFGEGDATFTWAAGRGFWLIKKGTWILANQQVPTAPLQVLTQAVHVKLHSGWNIITNPFKGHVYWGDIITANALPTSEQIHGWYLNDATPGSYVSAYAEPYRGYYLYNDPSNPVDSLKFPYSLSLGKTTRKASVVVDSSAWEFQVSLKAGSYRDEASVLGVRTLALEGKDRYDYHKPRPFPELPAAYFDRPDWDRYCSTFGSDFRAPFTSIGVWDLTVSTAGPKTGNVELNFSGIENVPKNFGVYLVDEAGARYRNLRQEGTIYKFVPATPLTRFKLMVGTKESLEKEVAKVLPHAFALEQNYPNPFNPSTTIPVTVPYAADVTLKIYNVIGEEVTTLHTGMLEPGRHIFTWEGRNFAGVPVASGVYFVRMTTKAGPSYTGKMLLMK